MLIQANGGACLLSVLDEKMNVQWSVANIITTDKKADIKSVCITNDGTVYLAIQQKVKEVVDMRLIPVSKGKPRPDIQIDAPNANMFAPQLLPSRQRPDLVELAGITVSEEKSRALGIFRSGYDSKSKR